MPLNGKYGVTEAMRFATGPLGSYSETLYLPDVDRPEDEDDEKNWYMPAIPTTAPSVPMAVVKSPRKTLPRGPLLAAKWRAAKPNVVRAARANIVWSRGANEKVESKKVEFGLLT